MKNWISNSSHWLWMGNIAALISYFFPSQFGFTRFIIKACWDEMAILGAHWKLIIIDWMLREHRKEWRSNKSEVLKFMSESDEDVNRGNEPSHLTLPLTRFSPAFLTWCILCTLWTRYIEDGGKKSILLFIESVHPELCKFISLPSRASLMADLKISIGSPWGWRIYALISCSCFILLEKLSCLANHSRSH